MKTILGEEHFIDKNMLKIYKLYDEQLTDGIYTYATKMGIQIDKQKFEHWLNFCAKLEQIDKSDLIDIAIKRKFDEKDYRIAVLERALKKACGKIGFVPLISDENIDDFYRKNKEATMDDYFIDQAEKELKDEKDKN